MDPDVSELVRPEDTFIAVMGVTGAGKSTFISHCTQQPVQSDGRGLLSCTNRVAVHTIIVSDQIVHLIDTPGFDDTGRSDSETLQELAYWLAAAYERSIQFSGIIYLHRITDIRLQGSALRSLRAVKSICGEENLHDIVIATTMWDRIAPNHVSGAFARQGELRERICKEMGPNGGSIVALPAGGNDAIGIVKQIIRKQSRMKLAFQKQLLEERRTIRETDVGQLLFDASRERSIDLDCAFEAAQKDMMEKIHTTTSNNAQHSKDATNEILAKLEVKRDEQRRFSQRLPELQKEWEERIVKEKNALQQERYYDQELFKNRNKVLADVRQRGRRDSEASSNSRLDMAHRVRGRNRYEQAVRLEELRNSGKNHALHGRTSAGFGIVGTGLAVGQLVAAMACTVM